MNSEERKKRLEEIKEEKELLMAEFDLKSIKSNTSRARSVTVGTAFGGVTEVSMRGDAGDILWCLLQPVEVTELIHQLAGNIGCHINIQPRKDFASWRQWKEPSPEEQLHLQGHPPHPSELLPHLNVGVNLPPPEKQPGMKILKKKVDNEPLAIAKTVDKRKSKRTSAST